MLNATVRIEKTQNQEYFEHQKSYIGKFQNRADDKSMKNTRYMANNMTNKKMN